MKSPQQLEGVLACPITHEPLKYVNGRMVSAGGRSYAMQEGVPILRTGDVTTMNPQHESNAVSEELQRFMRSFDGPVLFLGAGSTSFRADNVYELEYQRFRNTDMVGDAHQLPLADGSMAAVMAMNVFEHLADPPRACAEIHRVLRPGGTVFVHTAFLQPLHEAPAHFYNATEFGVQRWFQQFTDVEVTVSGNFNPYFALSWFASELLRGVRDTMDRATADAMARATLADVARGWETGKPGDWPLYWKFEQLPDALKRRLAAGFQLEAKKGSA